MHFRRKQWPPMGSRRVGHDWSDLAAAAAAAAAHFTWSWAVKKAEHQRIEAFVLWCWSRLLRVPWTAGRSNQSILKEISPEYSLEVLMLKLKLQYFGHLMQRTDSLGKTVMLGKIEVRRRRGRQRIRWLDGITKSMNISWASSGSWWYTGKPSVLQSMGLLGHDWATELTETEPHLGT